MKDRSKLKKQSFQPDRFSISLFKNISSNDQTNAISSLSPGRLYYSVLYNRELQKLYVTVNKIINVHFFVDSKNVKFFTLVDLCNSKGVILKRVQTSVVSSVSNPMFEQTFAFHVEEAVIDLLHLHFTICRRISSHNQQILGKVIFPMEFVKRQSKDKVMQEYWRTIVGKNQVSENNGIVLICLSFNDQDNDDKLLIEVIRAMNLPIRNNDVSVFFKVVLMDKVSEVETLRSKTVKTDIENPFFPTSKMVLDLKSHSFDDVYVVVYLCSRNIFGISHILGSLFLGPVLYSDTTGQIHWNESRAKRNRMIFKWHYLES